MAGPTNKYWTPLTLGDTILSSWNSDKVQLSKVEFILTEDMCHTTNKGIGKLSARTACPVRLLDRTGIEENRDVLNLLPTRDNEVLVCNSSEAT